MRSGKASSSLSYAQRYKPDLSLQADQGSPQKLSLQQRVVSTRVRGAILKDKLSLQKSLAETWIDSVQALKKPKKPHDKNHSVVLINQRSLDLFKEEGSPNEQSSQAID